jgi:hypothetical protein
MGFVALADGGYDSVMNRRQLLASVAAGAVGSATDGQSYAASTIDPSLPVPPLASPPPGVEYFTQERLERAIDTTVPTSHIDFTVACYVCNLWHPTPVLEKWFGGGFSEWEVMKRAQPNFPGHQQPKRPLWGCFPEDKVEWATREIDLAASSGIDVFMVDWYWHSGTMFLHEWLENAFLKSANRQKMKFALMWANHDWTNFYQSPESGQEAMLLPQVYSDADFDHLADYLIEHYFHQPNYWTIGGSPVFGIFNVDGLLNQFGGAGKLRATYDRMRERCVKSGLKGLHMHASHNYTPGQTPLEAAGFESATRYHTYPMSGSPQQIPWVRGAETSIKLWKDQAPGLKIPYFPNCPVGWDNSPRTGHRAAVFVNRTADQYERLLRAAKCFVAAQKTNPPVITLSNWNEWTEDHYLLPDEVHGYSYLEAVKRQFKGS